MCMSDEISKCKSSSNLFKKYTENLIIFITTTHVGMEEKSNLFGKNKGKNNNYNQGWNQYFAYVEPKLNKDNINNNKKLTSI